MEMPMKWSAVSILTSVLGRERRAPRFGYARASANATIVLPPAPAHGVRPSGIDGGKGGQPVAQALLVEPVDGERPQAAPRAPPPAGQTGSGPRRALGHPRVEHAQEDEFAPSPPAVRRPARAAH